MYFHIYFFTNNLIKKYVNLLYMNYNQIIFIIISFIILFILSDNYDNFNKTFNININSNDNAKIYVPIYSPWRMYYPLEYVYGYPIIF
jgi:hypothetical protein